ncbi:tRNA threonylcarbamoyladenosine biosynthesis protein TsaE [Picochlorum sp. SENEW3]|nr:tRNA threonylcarbamoyladenosine biosynthesis protein TsaE [Picochlorum sp. SENEW3]
MNRAVRSVLQYSRCLQRHPPRRGQEFLVCRCLGSRGGDQGPLCARVQVLSTSQDATAVLAAYFARQKCMPGDCYLLFGDVGAGKSYFSREFIRFALDDEEMEVPSPTFLLHNMYSGMNDGPPMIHHYDLYRLLDEKYSGVERLGFDNTVRSGVCLVEWPQVLEPLGLVPDERVELSFRLTSSSPTHEKDERIIDIRGFGPQWTRVVETLGEHIEQRGDALGLQYLSV